MESGNFRVDCSNSFVSTDFVLTTNTGSWQTLTAYFTALSSGSNYIWLRSSIAVSEFYVENLSIIDVSSDFDFDRASSATRINSDGLVQDMQSITDPELVLNGTFDTDSNWTFSNVGGTHGWRIADSRAICDTNAATKNRNMTSSLSLDSSKDYKLTLDILQSADNITVYVGGTALSTTLPTGENLGYEYYISSADHSGGALMLYAGSSDLQEIDNVSVKDITFSEDVDLARINYDSNGENGHILLEPSSTNLVTYSEDFDETTSDWANTNVSVEKNSTISPQGINNAAKITEDTSNDEHRIQFTFSQTINTNYSYSIFVKANGRDYFGINIGASRLFANFDLINETVTRVSSNGTDFNNESASITAFGNGWYKCTLSGYALTTNGSYIRFALRNISSTSSSLSYLGDGVSGAYVWGAQLEALPYATSYIPNHGTAVGVTRATETLTGSGNSTLINSTEGVLYAEIADITNDNLSDNNIISISKSTDEEFRVHIALKTDGAIQGFIREGAGNTKLDVSTTTVLPSTSFFKVAVLFESGNNKLYVNGLQIGSTDASTFSNLQLNSLQFNRGDDDKIFYGKCKALAVFNEALEDDELELLTGVTNYGSFGELASANGYTII